MRKAISVDERLNLTLRFLATGHIYSNVEADYKINRTKISGTVIEVCIAIYYCLKDEQLKIPQTKEDCLREKYPYSELFWFAFPRIRTEH